MATAAAVTKAIRQAFIAYRRSIPSSRGPNEGTWIGPRSDAREFLVETARALGLDDGDLHAAWRRMRQVKP